MRLWNRKHQAAGSAAAHDASGCGVGDGTGLRVDRGDTATICLWQADRELCEIGANGRIQRRSSTAGAYQQTSLTKSAPSRTFCLSFIFLSTPVCLRSSAGLIALDCFFFPFHVHPTGSAHSFHRPGVAHQTSLRSLLTMMSSSNSPHLGEAGRLFRDLITAMQDHVLKQAFPHGHHRASVATDRGDRTLDNQSGHAAGSRAGFPAYAQEIPGVFKRGSRRPECLTGIPIGIVQRTEFQRA